MGLLAIAGIVFFFSCIVFIICRISDGKPLPKNNDGTTPIKIKANYIEGLDNLIGQYKCIIANLDDLLLIEIKSNNLKIELPYNRIISIGNKIETHQETKINSTTKSPIARGLVGGALFGGAGLVLGGMSGLNSKIEGNTVTVPEDFLLIKYKTTDNLEKVLVFHMLEGYSDGLVRYVNKKIGNNIENTTIKL